jgi:hypothetical protein
VAVVGQVQIVTGVGRYCRDVGPYGLDFVVMLLGVSVATASLTKATSVFPTLAALFVAGVFLRVALLFV